MTAPVGVVGGILTQAYPTSTGSMTRLTVSLQREARYRVVPDGMTLRVIVAPRDPNPTTAVSPVTRSPQSGIIVRDVRFERVPAAVSGCAPNGCDRVVVELPSIPAYSLAPASSGRLRLELRGTILPTSLARTLDVTAYRGALKAITGSQDANRGMAVLDIERATDAARWAKTVAPYATWLRSRAKRPPRTRPASSDRFTTRTR